jgi:MFS family permease
MVTNHLSDAVRRSRRRLVPFLLLMYVLAFLDRANIGFAKQAFQVSVGISNAAYAFGAGLFFVTYALLEIPSNLIMHRIGARIWLARIMITWGVTSSALIFVRGPISFYVLRALLGSAEAGFFPGVILYLSYWFPKAYLARVLGLFYFGPPLAFILGGPLSGVLLEIRGLGLQGWQWMFLTEGLLASAVGVWALFYLNNAPNDADWLQTAEKEALIGVIAEENRQKVSLRLREVFGNPRVLHFVCIYFLIQASVYGVIFYLPAQVAAILGVQIGRKASMVTTVPWICAMAATYVLPRLADRSGKHRTIAAATLAASAIGIALSATDRPVLGLAALCVAAAAFMAVQPIFWTFPVSYLGGAAAASGIALINALGAFGGFAAPNIKNWAEASFHSSRAGLYVLAGAAFAGSLLILGLRSDKVSPAGLDIPALKSNDEEL